MPIDRTTDTALSVRWDAIALEAAAGATVSQLAEKFDYTYGGMAGLIASEQMQVRIGVVRSRLLQGLIYAQSKLMLSLPDLIEAELAVALPRNPDGTPTGVELTSPVSQKARHFLIERTLPQKQIIEQTTVHKLDGVAAEATTQIRDLLANLNAAAGERGRAILTSKHIHEGEDAVPKALNGAGYATDKASPSTNSEGGAPTQKSVDPSSRVPEQ